ncbi:MULTISPECIES: hypothetical protein [unclassified Mesorhizobium]|uniref:hypothetical protein n=1 Tax=unclassified Mesorhizobium TaxID=325217 RepID=UPI001CCAACDF|nr:MULTISPECIES: hypothetical protein [unclassified Mesorhizobium]MBZ9817387.1 hypothetical protein [Mesorhizobium sp. CA7]MBZ9863369.1 hypothetical protein [Mesorhizobium sp. CA12]MBZ9885079.1 hypothetical protein [Mesorhizobium sp. CA10]
MYLLDLVGRYKRAAVTHSKQQFILVREPVHEELENVSRHFLASRAVSRNMPLLADGLVDAGEHVEFVTRDDLAGIQHSLSSSKATKREECDKRVNSAINHNVIGRRWARGIAAAKEVLDRARIKAVEAAEGSFAVEGWHDMGFPPDRKPSEEVYSAAEFGGRPAMPRSKRAAKGMAR